MGQLVGDPDPDVACGDPAYATAESGRVREQLGPAEGAGVVGGERASGRVCADRVEECLQHASILPTARDIEQSRRGPWISVRPRPILDSVISLGLNGFAGADHDPAAALVVDAELVAAVEEERLTHVRHAPGGLPTGAVREVLALAGIDAGQVDVVTHGWTPEALGVGATARSEADRIRAELATAGVPLRPDARITFVDHHVAHFWSAVPFAPAGVSTMDALVLDGAGESTAGAFFRVRNGDVVKEWNLGLKGSLGLLYEAVTMALGFRRGQEGKTMGLASYGRVEAMTPVDDPADDRFPGPVPVLTDRDEMRSHHRQMILRARSLVPRGASFNQRADVALGVQTMLEQRVLALVAEITDPAPTLLLSGGVALNCTMNGRIARWCRERGITLVVPPPANDAGISVGAAVCSAADPLAVRSATGAALGRGFSSAAVQARLHALGAEVVECDPAFVADRLRSGAICGWYEGRAEVGPRALGRRAVLASPASAAMKDRLNVVKGREAWRPLAPSVRAEDFDASFDGVPSPYMLVASTIRPAALSKLVCVSHVDNSARPQAVTCAGEPAYWSLLGEMERGAVTCTSFNLAGKPIVYTPADAWDAARKMSLDLLAGDGWYVDLRA
ncbi:carbamoyltransferase C-terminal domain-containing protein [Plantactinospora sp. WMMC1484]|uniref:carbamoyltransferase C-terminal domain-containing protein n=1 Tax=Plantactinospora sp. WMMC1484 TaxID=3404122 RepID=UPI003BF56AE8